MKIPEGNNNYRSLIKEYENRSKARKMRLK